VVAAAGMAAAFSAGVAAWQEEAELDRRFGAAWRHYRRHVRRWLPSWRRPPANWRRSALMGSGTAARPDGPPVEFG
jgi:hypothetical protein